MEPLVRSTWSLCGERPVLDCLVRGKKFPTLGALALSPVRHQIRQLFMLRDENFDAETFVSTLIAIQKQVGRPIIVVWDNLPAHKSAVRMLKLLGITNIEIEWLPSYAPELNPVEPMWSTTKYGELANFVPDDERHLVQVVRKTLSIKGQDQTLLRSYFESAKLELGFP